jgi:hypothetical protein
MMVTDEESTETCQICICEMTQADELFPLHCPTRKCSFNVCLDCIIGMILSEADGYQLASDGSHQLRFRVRCPNCCVKYALPHCPKKSIVPYVATLRQAYQVRELLNKSDNTLRQAAYNRKKLFLKFTSLEEIKEALDVYEDYCEETGKLFGGRLDMADFLGLPRLKVPWADPSLFRDGEEKYLTDSEQQFLTQLICSGNPDSVAQGVVSLRSMMKRQKVSVSPVPEARESDPSTDGDGAMFDDTGIEPHDFIAQIFCGASPSSTGPCVSTSSSDNDDSNSEAENSMIIGPMSTIGTQTTWDEPIPEFDPNRVQTRSKEELMQRMFGLPPSGDGGGREPARELTRAACSFRSFRQRTSSRIRGIPPLRAELEVPEVVL